MLKLTFILLMLTLSCLAQKKPALEYQVKAAFLFNFTRFVHWPATAYQDEESPFVIGIAGTDPFGAYLDELVRGEKAEGRLIQVRRFADGEEITGCHILFINVADPVKMKTILAQANRKSILTVSDIDDFNKTDGMVRLYKEQNRIKIEIKLALAKAAQLEISAKLLQVANVK